MVLGKMWLVLASLYFYSYWNVDYLLIIVLSLCVNYALGKQLLRDVSSNNSIKIKKLILITGISLNLLLLGYYKYTSFIIENINAIFNGSISNYTIVLPLAISFFTFQQIAYLVDTYRKQCDEYDFLNYCLFVTFFPQLIAGPIVHHKEMMPQFGGKESFHLSARNITIGLIVFSIGLFKKVIIADQFAIWANQGFDNVDSLLMLDAWLASLSYTFQLYYDFSGYADMAMGIALLFNIKLPVNFNSPYKAINIQDFWRRWHMTLSRWLKDYVYIPLGGSRCGRFLNLRNLFLTAFISGIWHGAGWTFIVWGALHGLAMIFHRLWSSLGIKLNKAISWFITFNFVNICWVVFRSNEIHDALNFISVMFGAKGGLTLSTEFNDVIAMVFNLVSISEYVPSTVSVFALPSLVLALFAVVIFENSNEMLKLKKISTRNTAAYAVFAGLALSAVLASRSTVFLYFNF